MRIAAVHPSHMSTIHWLSNLDPASSPKTETFSATKSRAGRAAGLAVFIVILAHLWVISAGWWTHCPQYTSCYDRLCDALIHGQCSLRSKPDPGLLALSDPYDPVANAAWRRQPGVHDAVLFNGKYYFYWGPAPALLLAPVKFVLGPRSIGDQYPAFAFAMGLTIFGAMIMHRIWLYFFQNLPSRLLFAGILIAGLSTPMPYTLARSAVYEAAILGGQCFLVAGIFFAFPLDRAPGPRRLVWASVCWSLALGCRISLLFSIAAMCLILTFQLTHEVGARTAARRLVALSLPLLVAGALLAAYNVARFAKWSEFGQQYQLNSANYHRTPHLFQPANAVPGLYSYLLRPIELHPDFPFVSAIAGEGTFPSWMRLPEHYECYEPIAGILVVTPIIVFSLIPICRLLLRRNGRAMHRVTLVFLCASVFGFAPIPFMLGSTMRYLCDLMPCLLLLACIGLWQAFNMPALRTWVRGRAWRFFVAGTIVTAGWSVAIGILLGITGYYGHFSRFHPYLFGSASYWTRESANPSR